MSEPPAPPPDETRASRWEDFIDLLYAPGSVFARRVEAPFGLPLLALTLVLTLLLHVNMTVLEPIYAAELERSFEAAGQPAAAMDEMRRIGRIFGLLAFALGFPLAMLVVGLILWGGTSLFGGVTGFRTAGLIATYSQLPVVFQQLAVIVQGIVLDVESMWSMHQVSVSAARFLPPDADRIALALAARLDLFLLWSAALMAIGLVRASRLSTGQAVLLAGLIWGLASLPEIVGALLAR